MKYYHFVFVVFVFLTVNCQSVKSLNEIRTTEKLLSYERTPCFGRCPTYEVTVLKDGKAYFVGKNYVPYLDTAVFQLPERTLYQVKAILQHPDYLKIIIEEPEEYVTDIPGLNFQDFEHDRTYELDQVIPEAIQVIADKIDKVLEEKKFIYNKELYPMILKEILVELKSGTDPYSLDGKDTFYQLSYRDSIGANIYKYELICAEEAVDRALTALKQRKGVRETQLNHELERR